jgi:AcrR family transcriptional regulator
MKAGRKPTHGRDELMSAALTVAQRDGYRQMSCESVAIEGKCSRGLINKYFGTMLQLRRAVMRAAVVRRNLLVIAQGLAAGDVHANEASTMVKRDALEGLLL